MTGDIKSFTHLVCLCFILMSYNLNLTRIQQVESIVYQTLYFIESDGKLQPLVVGCPGREKTGVSQEMIGTEAPYKLEIFLIESPYYHSHITWLLSRWSVTIRPIASISARSVGESCTAAVLAIAAKTHTTNLR